MVDVRKNYSKKYNCHLCPICKSEEETTYHLVSCNTNMSFEDYRKVYERDSNDIQTVTIAVKESIRARDRFV